MSRDEVPAEVRALAKDRADWLLDAVATSTQDRRYLRGEPQYDEVAGEAILLNGEKAIWVAIMADRAARAGRTPSTDQRAREEAEVTLTAWEVETVLVYAEASEQTLQKRLRKGLELTVFEHRNMLNARALAEKLASLSKSPLAQRVADRQRDRDSKTGGA